MVACLSVATASPAATIVTYTYTGAGASPNNWAASNNWSSTTGLYPGYQHFTGGQGGTDIAVITNSLVPVFTNMVDDIGGTTLQLNGLTTGTNKVTFTGGVRADRCYDNTVAGVMIIGSGGVEGTTILAAEGTYGVASLSVAGNVKANDFGSGCAAPTLIGTPVFDVKTFYTPQSQGSGNYFIPATWNFINVDANNLTFLSSSIIGNMTHTWTGTPNFNGGRPNYQFIHGGDSQGKYAVGPYTLLGNLLQLDGWPYGGAGADGRWTWMTCNGGTVDVSRIDIAYGFANKLTTYIAFTNSAVFIRGTGTVAHAAWYNRSTNNLAFNLRAGTTTTFDPDGVATQYVDTGSRDRESFRLDSVDWNSNFAFDTIRIGAGDTVTLVGNANIEGGGISALYATQLVGLGGGATLKLNGHNVYLLRRATGVIFDTTGGGHVFQLASGTVVIIH